jgi:hypothetical protein
VKSFTVNELYEAKKARRRRLANLSLDEKIALIEKLRDAGKSLIAARATLGKPCDEKQNNQAP